MRVTIQGVPYHSDCWRSVYAKRPEARVIQASRMTYVTLNSGHTRQSLRSEIRDDVIRGLQGLEESFIVYIEGPALKGYSVTVGRSERGVGDAVFTIWRYGAAVRNCTLAVEHPDHLWANLLRTDGRAHVAAPGIEMPPETPWLAVMILDTSRPEDLDELAQFELSVAWALLEPTAAGPGGTRARR